MATVLEGVLPKSSVLLCVFFCGQKDSMQRILIKKCFLFVFRSICRVNRLYFADKHFDDNEEVETEVWKWQSQESRDFYAADFDALVMRRDKRINVGGGYVEK
jgi:hypothetical protein